MTFEEIKQQRLFKLRTNYSSRLTVFPFDTKLELLLYQDKKKVGKNEILILKNLVVRRHVSGKVMPLPERFITDWTL